MERLSRREFLQATAIALAYSTRVFGQPSTLFRIPYVQNVCGNHATVRWTTTQPGDGVVEFWDGALVAKRAYAQAKAFMPNETGMKEPYYCHDCDLTELQPGTTYHYRVLMNGQSVDVCDQGFRTPGSEPFEFLAFGDSGQGTGPQGDIAQRMLEHDARFVVHTGDLVYPTGTYARYETLYFAYYKDLMRGSPFFPCPGNHDYYEMNAVPYRAVHAFPQQTVGPSGYGRYYSFDWGNAHFVSLDSNDALKEAVAGSGGMLSWLDDDLRQTSKFWRIVFLHHAAYSVGLHYEDLESQLIREYIAPILDKYSASMVLNGHEHSYQRSAPMAAGRVAKRGDHGTVYVTTGGGGAQLHPVSSADFMEVAVSEHHFLSCSVNAGQMNVRALRPDGSELDSFVISPKPVVSSGGVVNAASFTPGIAAGGLIAIFGQYLALDDVHSEHYPLPKQAAGTTVLVNGQPLPILMASATQLTVQLPCRLSGNTSLTVQTPNGALAVPVSVDAVAPALFEGAIFHHDGIQVSADQPARPEESVNVYLTGLGDCSPESPPGQAAPLVFSRAQASVVVRLDDLVIDPEFAGLAPGVAGVNLVTFSVPRVCRRGSATLRILVNGIESNGLVLPIA